MKAQQKFDEDLLFGKIFEGEFKQILEQDGWNVRQSEGYVPEYDLYCTKDNQVITYECKTDRETDKTGNVAIEVGKVLTSGEYANGIYNTQAMFHAFKLLGDDYFYIIETVRLRYLVENGFTKFNARGGDGDRTKLQLIDLQVFKDNCHTKIKRKEVPERVDKIQVRKTIEEVIERFRSKSY